MPLISMITGGIDFSDWKLVLNEAVIDTQGTVVTPEVAINYGNLILGDPGLYHHRVRHLLCHQGHQPAP